MNFRSDSLHDRLTLAQRHDLMICITDAAQNPAIKDRYKAGLALCDTWQVKTSRTCVRDFFQRYNFGWRLELGAWAAKHTEGMSDFDKESRLLVTQKLFAEITDADCPVKTLIMIRSLQIEQDKLDLAKKSAETRFSVESRKLKLAERRVVLLEANQQRALDVIEKAKKRGKGGISKETLEEVERQLKML
jgi:hypothetical protein